MATGNEKLQIDITAKDDASKVVDGLQKKVDKLEKAKPTVEVAADTKSAEHDVEGFAKKIEKLTAEDQVVLLSLKAAAAQHELTQLGTDIAQLDSSDPTVEIKLDRYAEVSGDLESLQGRIKSIADTPIDQGGLGGGLSNVKTKLEGMRGEADQSRSVLANMVGNSTQDLGELGGVAGTAGMALGQFAEYATEGNISLSGLAKVAGPLALVATAVYGITSVMDAYRKSAKEAAEIEAFNVKNAKEFAQWAAEGKDAVAEYVDQARDAGKLEVAPDVDDFNKALDAMGLMNGSLSEVADNMREVGKIELHGVKDMTKDFKAAGVGAEEFLQAASPGNQAGFDALVAKIQDSGVSLKQQATLIAALIYQQDQFATGAQDAATRLAVFGKAVDETAEAHTRLASSMEASAAQQDIANRSAEDAQAVLDAVNAKLQEHIDKLREDADALNAQAGAYGSAADDQLAYNDAIDEFNTKAKDSEASTEDIRDAAIGAAKAHAELYTSLTEASGGVATSTGKLDAQNQSLLEAAKTARGPARQAIVDYIGALNGIPPEQLTEISPDVNVVDLAAAQAQVDELSAARDVTITADAKTADAEAEINAVVNKKRTAYVTLTPLNGQFATGGVVGPEGGIAGEKRPELIEKGGKFAIVDGPTPVSPGTKVYSGSDTAKMMQAGDLGGGHSLPTYAGGTQNITHTVTPANSPVAATASVEDAAEAAVKAQDRLKANAYELGRITRDEYLAYLQQQQAGTEDLSDEQVAYYRLIKGLQQDTAREQEAAAATAKKASDDAAKAALDAVKAEQDRVTAIYRQAQAERDAIESEAAHGKAIAAVFAAKTPEDLAAARESAGAAIYRTILARAKAAGLDEGSVEWDRFVRAQLTDADQNTAGSGIGEVLARYFAAIPALASGGIVPATPGGSLVRVGEAGKPEAVVPLGSGLGAAPVTVNMTIQAYDPSTAIPPRVVANLISAIEKAQRRNGRGGLSAA